MLKTTLFFSVFWVGLMLSLVLLLFYYLIKIAGLRTLQKNYVYFVTNRWSKFTLFTAGVKLDVKGKENLPVHPSGFVIISNHQGNFDIPVFMAALPFALGFISKKELMKLPFLSSWMNALNCLPIDRNNPRDSRERISGRIRRPDLNPVFLFPEGTRSKGPEMGPFRTGTLKLLFHDRIDVLPVTINGTYKCFEKYKTIKEGKVNVVFHPVMKTSGYESKAFASFNTDLQNIIAAPLKSLNL